MAESQVSDADQTGDQNNEESNCKHQILARLLEKLDEEARAFVEVQILKHFQHDHDST